MQRFHASDALLSYRWHRDVGITVDADGTIVDVVPGADPAGAVRLAGPVVPGVPNLHSHAFQRAMAGLAETVDAGRDGFWSWRQKMYQFVSRMTPEDVEAVAAWLYVEMLRNGYTAVGEFHYLHRQPDGQAYADPAEMAERLAAAARAVGIGLTLLPSVYVHGWFGAMPLVIGQERFRQSPDEARRLAEEMLGRHRDDPQFAVGLAPHSLRAVGPAELAAALDGLDPGWPVHIHAAEQVREVEHSVEHLGAAPVTWLLDNAPVDRRWCLVHATHMDADETGRLARSGAVAGLCPTTEADLGDGVFPAQAYVAAWGRYGIGSDSQVCTDPAMELRALEYAQRLTLRARVVVGRATSEGRVSCGGALLLAAWDAGATALGRPIGRIAPGYRADLVVLDGDAPGLVGRGGHALLNGWLFAPGPTPVRDVFVGGRQVVQDGKHSLQDRALDGFRQAVRRGLA